MSRPYRSTVARAWVGYRDRTFRLDVRPMHLVECRRAFYAGAEMVLAVLNTLDPGPEATQADEDYMDGLHRELLTFAQDVKEGRA